MNVRYHLFLALFCLTLNPAYSQERKDRSDNETEIPAFNFEVIKVQHTGPDANRVKLGYASDGYTAAELQDFPAQVENSVKYLTIPSLATRPLPRYKNFINIYRIDLISRESGISVAPRYNRKKTKTVNNALGGTRDEDRLGWVDRQLASALFSQAADRTGIQRFNWPFVVLNNPEYHNSGGRYVVFSYNFGKEIGLHEAGHGFFDLADEYYGEGTFEGDEPRNINVTADPDAEKWSHWMGYVDKDTLLGTIGVYEGAIYTSRGAYRPSKNSKMGWTSDRKPASFNAVCREKIILDIYDIVSPVDKAMDTAKIYKNPVSLWVKVVDPEVILVDWYVNDKLVLENGGTSVKARELIKEPGEYKVKAHAYDEVVKHAFSDNDNPHPLDLVRRDLDKLQQYVEWTVVID